MDGHKNTKCGIFSTLAGILICAKEIFLKKILCFLHFLIESPGKILSYSLIDS